MIDTTLLVKIIGASIGSSIAVVFEPAGDSWFRLFKRFVIGTIIGVISAPVVIDLFSWEHKVDYWLASASLCGLVGYMLLQLLFSEQTRQTIRKRFKDG